MKKLQIQIKILFLQVILATYFINCNLNITIDTRYCPNSQLGGSNEQFGQRLKNYVENSPQPSGYCVMNNPQYPIQNKYECGAEEDIGWLWLIEFDDNVDSHYEIDFATDFGLGSAIFVDGVFFEAYQQDLWWHHDWNDEGVFHLVYDFTAGNHEVLIVGQDHCCDGDMIVRFSRNGQAPKELTQENLDCAQTNNCQGVVCQDSQWQNGWDCINCSYKCETCVDNQTCRSCSHSTRQNPPDCNCPDGYYNKEGYARCRLCKFNCLTCSNNNSCDSCRPGMYLQWHDHNCKNCKDTYGSLCGECNNEQCLTCDNNTNYLLPECQSDSCLSNQFQVGNYCQNCLSQCKTCSDDTFCLSCEDTEYIQNGDCISCSATYGSHCGSCNAFICLSCATDPSYVLPNCNSSSCAVNQTQDGNICYDCEQKCLNCTDSTTCTECINGTYLQNNDCFDCVPPCLTCSSQNTCLSCDKTNYDLTTGCTNCLEGFYMQNNQCLSCSTYFGENCGTCDENECLTCLNDSNFFLPQCISNSCPEKTYQDNKICRQCLDNCESCSNGVSCDYCKDKMYQQNGLCYECQSPCYLCSDANTCIVCNQAGWKPPFCTECQENWFLYESECIKQCPQGYYEDRNIKQCRQCDNSCIDCENDAYYCTSCPNLKVLYKGKCTECDDIYGMEQVPGQAFGICREICGDGIRLTEDLECDDGNKNDNDGCNSNCEIEAGWDCDGGDGENKDICQDQRPIGFTVDFLQQEQYLNVEKQADIECLMIFNKTFILPEGKKLQDYVVIDIEGKNSEEFKINVEESSQRRILQSNEPQQPEYLIKITPTTTVKNRQMTVDIYPKSDFNDGSGNTLVENEVQKSEIKEYYYYSEEERQGTAYFELWMQIGILLVMLFLPFYVFVYKNHFNKFYVLFIVVDITQILYFYRFINIRWPINGIKFYQKLRPVISFYMWNFYKKEIPENEFEQYSSGVKKFDSEREDALFLNNAGSMLSLLFIMIFMYFIVVFFSWKKLYKDTQNSKIYNFFFQFRYGYFEWGIWFDSILASSGVFIIYIFLQMTNINSKLNFSIAAFVGAFYFGFFVLTLLYVKKNLKNLYSQEIDEEVDDKPLVDKIATNPTFKLRNIWHFILKVDEYPRKAYFYYMFIFRKIYIALTLLTLQDHPKIQLCLFSFSHAAVIILVIKNKFFKQTKETFRICLSEFFVLGGVGCMYFMLDDSSEDESFRLKYSWYVLGCLLMSLFIQGIFFFWQEIIEPIVYIVIFKMKGNRQKIVNLRELRNNGNQEVHLDEKQLQKIKQTIDKNELESQSGKSNSQEENSHRQLVNSDTKIQKEFLTKIEIQTPQNELNEDFQMNNIENQIKNTNIGNQSNKSAMLGKNRKQQDFQIDYHSPQKNRKNSIFDLNSTQDGNGFLTPQKKMKKRSPFSQNSKNNNNFIDKDDSDSIITNNSNYKNKNIIDIMNNSQQSQFSQAQTPNSRKKRQQKYNLAQNNSKPQSPDQSYNQFFAETVSVKNQVAENTPQKNNVSKFFVDIEKE